MQERNRSEQLLRHMSSLEAELAGAKQQVQVLQQSGGSLAQLDKGPMQPPVPLLTQVHPPSHMLIGTINSLTQLLRPSLYSAILGTVINVCASHYGPILGTVKNVCASH